MELEWDGGVQATWEDLFVLLNKFLISVKYVLRGPQVIQVRPAGAPTCPRSARFTESRNIPTDDQSSPGQEGEAVAKSWLRQVGDGAGVVGKRREDFDRGEAVHIVGISADYQLP